MKYIIYKTRLRIKDSNDKIIIPGVRIVDNEFEITEHIKSVAESNEVHEKLITINCYPIPDEKYDERKKVCCSTFTQKYEFSGIYFL